MNNLITDENKKEIFYNIVNSILAGALVFVGSIADGNITKEGLMIAVGVSSVVALTKFKNYWSEEKREYCKNNKFLNFIP